MSMKARAERLWWPLGTKMPSPCTRTRSRQARDRGKNKDAFAAAFDDDDDNTFDDDNNKDKEDDKESKMADELEAEGPKLWPPLGLVAQVLTGPSTQSLNHSWVLQRFYSSSSSPPFS